MSNFRMSRIGLIAGPDEDRRMRVVLLGGAGEVGSEVARDLAAVAEIDALVIADVDAERAHALAREVDRRGVTATTLDVRDRPRALELLAGTDVLMNCTSFALFDDVLDLALAARVDYADLISEPTSQQRRSAESAGIAAISGLGASPGLSNILVRHAAEELDELRTVEISWISLRTVAPTPGLLDTILWEVSENCPTRTYYKDGRHKRAAFLEGSRLVEFAPPVGRQFVYYVPHPEVRTLPRHFPTLRDCAVRGSYRPELMADMRVLERYGLLADGALAATRQAIWDRCGGARDSTAWVLCLNIEISGVREGEPVHRTYDVSHPLEWGERGIARMTGLPASVGVQLLARHGRRATGFVDPEQYYDPFEFLAELERRNGITVTCTEAISANPLERTPA
jgi:saccharopine dehydrogenase-like NADP-dependent oxidoreductase